MLTDTAELTLYQRRDMTDKTAKQTSGTIHLTAAAPEGQVTPAGAAKAPAPSFVCAESAMPVGETIKTPALIDRVIARAVLKGAMPKPLLRRRWLS